MSNIIITTTTTTTSTTKLSIIFEVLSFTVTKLGKGPEIYKEGHLTKTMRPFG